MTPLEENYHINSTDTLEKINLKEYFERYMIHWRWFLFCILISLFCAFAYLKYANPIYRATAYIMIKDNLKSGISDELKAVADLGIVGTSSTNNPDNEIFIIKSRKIVGRMVDSLELTTCYFSLEKIKNKEIYKNNFFKLHFLKRDTAFHNLDTTFLVSRNEKETFLLKSTEGEIIKEARYNQIIQIGDKIKFKILPNKKGLNSFVDKRDIMVVIKPRDEVIDAYQSKIEVAFVHEDSSVLSLSIDDSNRVKAENILDELINQYNMDAVIDKNIVSNKTKLFIDDRLQSITFHLAGIQDNLKDYKTKFGISGSPREGQIILEVDSENNKKNIELKTQLNLINWVLQELRKSENELEPLPTNLGFTDETTSMSIINYNELVLDKLRVERNAGIKNPNLLVLKNKIKTFKKNIYKNFYNLQKSIEIQISELSYASKKVKNRISEIPEMDRGIIDIQIEKSIYSELYTYLLKKKEETSISLAITVPNAKTIDAAYSSKTTVFPRKFIVYFIALFFGLIIPFTILYLYYEFDNKIHYRKDIEKVLKIPYIGDIPNTQNHEKIIVSKTARTSTAEAFRLLRTNLNFLLSNKKSNYLAKTIFVTSTISGEGKSFVSINLAVTLALTNKKVLLLGLDLRSPKITEYLGVSDKKGITNYILDDKISIEEITFKLPQIENVDFISSGLIPPNPSELLLHQRVNDLFEVLKKKYDYIIADTAPASLVTDTLMVADYSDLFLYVVRANYLEKRMLIVPETLYKEKKLPNMAMLLNDTDSKRGYGYGYGVVEQEKKSRLGKIYSDIKKYFKV
jgi:capsular exopolysaccharide synthesis family protein